VTPAQLASNLRAVDLAQATWDWPEIAEPPNEVLEPPQHTRLGVKRLAFADPEPQLLSITRDGSLTAVDKPVVDFRASRSTCE
jgi:hypothetical protein